MFSRWGGAGLYINLIGVPRSAMGPKADTFTAEINVRYMPAKCGQHFFNYGVPCLRTALILSSRGRRRGLRSFSFRSQAPAIAASDWVVK
jgi:hypothetical protein